MAKIKKQKITDHSKNGISNVNVDNEKSPKTDSNSKFGKKRKNKLNKKMTQNSELKVVSKSIKKVKKKAARTIDAGALINDLLKEESVKPKSDTLQGFKVIKWKLAVDSETEHQLFIKKHEVAISDLSREKPPGKTILCHNVPPYLNDGHLREIFGTFGSIEKIFIHQNPTASVPEKYDRLFFSDKEVIRGFKVAYIVYLENKSVKEVLEMNPKDVEPVVLTKPLFTGVPRWISQYNTRIVSTQVLEKSVRKFMDNFDKDEVKRKELEKNANEPDDDGWVTVTRTGKRSSGGLVRSEAMEERLRAKKRRQDKQLLNFTPAQVKESKMKKLMELKKKFDDDKQRVALMKQQRKFKPF